MKKTILIIFTFLGIYAGFAQKPLQATDSIPGRQNVIANMQPNSKQSAAVKEKPSIHLYPNPAKNKVEIDIKGFDPGYVKIQLVDNKGEVVRADNRLVLSGSEVIVLMFSEKPGFYFLWLKQGVKILKSKLIIQ